VNEIASFPTSGPAWLRKWAREGEAAMYGDGREEPSGDASWRQGQERDGHDAAWSRGRAGWGVVKG
jgi:hypothetical protein